MKNILFISYYFYPSAGPAVKRSIKFTKYLRKHNFNPIVVTAPLHEYEEFGYGIDRSWERDVPKDLSIFRVSSNYPVRTKNLFKKLKLTEFHRYFFFTDLYKRWALSCVQTARDIAMRYPLKAVYTTSSPYNTGLAGELIKKELSIPWVSDYRDGWTTKLSHTWPTRLHYEVDRKKEERFHRRSDLIIANTEGDRNELLKKFQLVAPSKVTVIPNGYDAEDFMIPHESCGKREKFIILFAGSFYFDRESKIYSARDLLGQIKAFLLKALSYNVTGVDKRSHSPAVFFEALDLLRKENPRTIENLELHCYTILPQRYYEMISRLKLESNIFIHQPIPHCEIIKKMMEADMSLLTLMVRKDGQRLSWVPGKTYEYIAAEKPILALIAEGDCKDVVEKYARTYISDNPLNPKSVARTLEKALKECRHAGITAPSKNLEEIQCSTLTQRLAKKIDQIIQSPSSGRSPNDFGRLSGP